MKVKDLENDLLIKRWVLTQRPSKNTYNSNMTAMQHYTEFTGMTPQQLLDSAESEIKAGKLMRERELFTYTIGFRDYLEERGTLAPLTIRNYMACVRAFYSSFYIDLPKLPKAATKATRLKQNSKVPDKDNARQALEYCDSMDTAIMLCGLSSGMGASEISSLTIEVFNEGYDPETEITTIDMRRVKREVDFVTFLTPEATRAVKAYLAWRDAPTRSTRQHDILVRKKRSTTPDSYLFITRNVPDEYLTITDAELKKLKTTREELRRLTANAIVKRYRTISNNAGMSSPKGVYNLIRSHNMRKWFNSTMKNAGCDSERVEYFMGHTLGSTRGAYYEPDIELLKTMFKSFCPYLTIRKELDVAESPEYASIKNENDILRAETARHIVERSEFADIKAKHDKMEERVKEIEKQKSIKEEIISMFPEEMQQFLVDEFEKRKQRS